MLRHKWETIRAAIDDQIATGALQPGDKLPTEPELSERFGAGRHSVRRAIAELARDGKLSVEQGRGTYVSSAPRITYSIGRRTRLRQNLTSQNIDVTREFLGADRISAPLHVAKPLQIEPGAPVIRSRNTSYADGLPISSGMLFHCAQTFPDFVERRTGLGSVTETYKSYGIKDYMRRETSIESRQASVEEAKVLAQHALMPVIVIRAVDAHLDGTPIACSEVIWSAARVRFTVSPEDF